MVSDAASDDGLEPLPDLEALPAGDVLGCLVRLHRGLTAALPALGVPAVRVLAEEYVAALAIRGRRLEDLARESDEVVTAAWAEGELPPVIDAAGRLLSAAREQGGDDALATLLERALYEELRPVCVRRGWFDLVIVRPLSTRFDPACHQVVERRPSPNDEDGVVLALVRMGRRSVETGALIDPALVVVAG